MEADNICERYAEIGVGLTVRLLESDEIQNSSKTVLIEGPPMALKMLAELLSAISKDPLDKDFSISPFGAGSVHFSSKAELGIYIHCLRENE